MKKLIAILFLCSVSVSAQLIQKKDGTKIDVSGGTIHVEPGNKRLAYLLKDSKKEMHVKFNELDQATWGDFLFRIFVIDGKNRGFYVVTESEDKVLVTTKRVRIKSRGGFESTYTHYDVAVLDKQNKILEELSFTDENNEKKSAERAQVIPLVKKYFPDCPRITERAAAFESPASDTRNNTILVLLNDPTFINCN